MTDLISRPPASPGSDASESSPGASTRARWEWPAFAALIVGTGVLYLWNLSTNGWANSFYSAAIQAGSQSWKAWFFGSSDAANSITVDKPPMSLWIPAIAVRIFGLNSWSIIVPQALMGVASVALLYWIVRTRFGPGGGLIAGAALALTPVAALMFRFNNPDALLVLLMIAAVWAMLKGIDDGRVRWMILTGVLVGFGFLTKQMQVFLVIPPLALTYIAFGQKTWLVRLGHLFAALGAMLVSAGWWVLAVELWPKDSRPYIGGSQNNSILELTFGYNGFGRLFGNEIGGGALAGGGAGDRSGAPMAGDDLMPPAGAAFTGPGGAGPGGGGGMWGDAGITRMFDTGVGGQIAWLIPAAIILGIAAIVLRGRTPRTDSRRALLTVWVLWLVTTAGVFSFMGGIFHEYYTVALAPAIAALVGAGAVECWRQRERLWVPAVLAAAALATGVTSFVLLNRSAEFLPWLRYLVLVGSIAAALGVLLSNRRNSGVRRGAVIAGLVAVVLGLAGPAAYAVETVGSSKGGSIPSAGPASQGGFGPGGGRPMPPGDSAGGAGQPGIPDVQGDAPPSPGGQDGSTLDQLDAQIPQDDDLTMFGMGAGMGGPMEGSQPSEELVDLLTTNADAFTWVAATIGATSASGYQLATERSVMPIGGFSGGDPSPTLAGFQDLVEDGAIHYFIASGGRMTGGGTMGGGGRMMGGGGSTGSAIAEWVEANFASTTVDGVTLYDLTAFA
ncbi:MAG: ArnT family glycosyltransferase [Dietzia sp.]